MPPIPKKTIAIWHSTIATIPAGWHHCDGTSDTPDLRDKFIVGAGQTYNPGDSGGSENHTHPFTSDGHTHGFPITVDIFAGPDFANITDSDVLAGTTQNGNVLPPYFSLPYIMRI